MPARSTPAPATSAISTMIAEEALALLAAFAEQDAEEVSFRTTMLLSYARDTGNRPLAVSCIALLEEAARFTKCWNDQGMVVCSLEQVITAAVNLVAPISVE